MAAIFSRKRDVIRLLPALAQSYSLSTAASENINLKPCGYASSYTCLQLGLNAELNSRRLEYHRLPKLFHSDA